MDAIDKFGKNIDKLGVDFIKWFILLGIIVCIGGIITYFKEGDNALLKKGTILTIVLIVMFIVTKIKIGAN